MAIPIRYDRAAILHVHPHKKNARRHSREGTSPRTSIRGRNPLGSSCENMVTSHRVGITHAIRLGLILSLSLLWFFANTGQSLACSCVRPGSPSEELAQSSSVFAGRVVSVREFNDPNATHDYSSTDPTTVEFEVDTIWKGSSTTKPFTLRPRDQRQAAALRSTKARSTSSTLATVPLLACAAGLPYSRTLQPISTSWDRDARPNPALWDLHPNRPRHQAEAAPSLTISDQPPQTRRGSASWPGSSGSVYDDGLALDGLAAVGVFPYPPLDTVLRQDISQMVGRHSDGVGRGSSGVRAQLEDH